MTRRSTYLVIALFCIAIFGCLSPVAPDASSSASPSQSADTSRSASASPRSASNQRSGITKTGTAWHAKLTQDLSPAKQSFDVTIDQPLSDTELRDVAHILHSVGVTSTFITFYLNGMISGTGAWATTHFNPDLSVEVLGLTPAELSGVLAGVRANTAILGRWHGVSPGRVLELRVSGQRNTLIYRYPQGNSTHEEVRRKSRQVFESLDGATTFRVNPNDGSLRLEDGDGVWASYARLTD